MKSKNSFLYVFQLAVELSVGAVGVGEGVRVGLRTKYPVKTIKPRITMIKIGLRPREFLFTG